MDARDVDVVRELARLRAEIEELRTARRRLVLAADDDRRAIERDLHDGVHQRLVALAVNLQLARRAADSDPGAVISLLDEMDAVVEQALDETALLAQRTSPELLEAEGLAALLRAAAVTANASATIDVEVGSGYSREVVMTVYLCWLDTLAREDDETQAAISVREYDDALVFEVVGAAGSDAERERVRDRVEALGGELTTEPDPGGGIRLCGRLPLSR